MKKGDVVLNECKISDLSVGQFHEEEYVVTEEMGKEFAEISQDFNSIHLDKEFAEHSRFGQRIVHGMLVGSYISGIIGNKFPGPGSIYMSQTLNFCKPIYYNQKFFIKVEVTKIDKEKHRVMLRTICRDAMDNKLVDGEAKIYIEK